MKHERNVERLGRDVVMVALVLLVGVLTGVAIALMPLILDGRRQLESGAQRANLLIAPDTGLNLIGASPEMAAPASGQVAPAAAGPAVSPEMAEACRQAAVNGRRSSPRCRDYFVSLGVGR